LLDFPYVGRQANTTNTNGDFQQGCAALAHALVGRLDPKSPEARV
jgi:hypothetical protein